MLQAAEFVDLSQIDAIVTASNYQASEIFTGKERSDFSDVGYRRTPECVFLPFSKLIC